MTAEQRLFSTGIAGLDSILGGGLSRPSLAVIIGAPGAGKTILASHMIFNAARQGLQTLIFTSFSEGIEQYLQHMSSLSFFDADLVGNTVQIFTLASLMTDDETTPAVVIARTIRATQAKIVLLDGFQGADSLLPADQTTRMILSAVATHIRYLDTTMLVTMAGEVRDDKFHTEMTAADAAIGLRYAIQGRRHQRLIEVVKLRGRAQQPGLHSYRIDGNGIQIFPRIEGYPLVAKRPTTTERAPFQLPELDRLLRGGLTVGTTTLLAGAPGVGKTTLGLQWALAQAQADAVSVFVTFVEHPEQLARKAAAFGFDVHGAIETGRVQVVRLSAADINPDEVAMIIVNILTAPEVSRLVVDDLSTLLHELGDRARDYLSALNDLIYSANVTGLYMLEIAPFEGMRLNVTNSPLAVLGDNVIVVQQYELAGHLRRLLAVLRMRLSFFDHTIRELVIDETGIRILAYDEATRQLMSTETLSQADTSETAPHHSDEQPL